MGLWLWAIRCRMLCAHVSGESVLLKVTVRVCAWCPRDRYILGIRVLFFFIKLVTSWFAAIDSDRTYHMRVTEYY